MHALICPERAALVGGSVERGCDDQRSLGRDSVAEEVPVALEYNGISHAVMLASPYDLEDFALGFSLSEGILADASELFDCEVSFTRDGIQVQMRIASGQFAALKGKRRNLTGRTGCGLCGAETLQQAIRRPAPVTSSALFSAEMLYAGIEAMQVRQHLQHQTGATHAAAWLGADGQIELGIGFLAAISAPTSLAVKLAEEANLTLVGFVRRQNHVVYAQSHRLVSAVP